MVDCGMVCKNRELRCYDCGRNREVKKTIDYYVPIPLEAIANCSSCGASFEKNGLFTQCPKCLNEKFDALRDELGGKRDDAKE